MAKKSANKSKVKHPERYAFVCFTCMLMYVCLVVVLYRSRDWVDALVLEASKPINPQRLLVTSSLDAEVPDKKHSVIREPHVAFETNSSILVFVQSRRSDIEKRYLIRDTWARSSEYRHLTDNRTLCVIFAIGNRPDDDFLNTDLELEMRHNRDILLLNMTDTYDKLTLKGLLTMNWINQRLPHVHYVIKTDDDIFLNPFAWMDMVEAAKTMHLSCVIFGYVWIYPAVLRSGKYSVTKKQFRFDHYPSFCSGAAYMIPRDSLAAILEATEHIPLFLRDDPYFTGIVAQSMGIRLITLPLSTLKLSEDETDVRDPTREPFLILHGISDRLWHRTWRRLLQRRQDQDRESLIHLRTIQPNEVGLRLAHLQNVTLEHDCPKKPLPIYFNVRI